MDTQTCHLQESLHRLLSVHFHAGKTSGLAVKPVFHHFIFPFGLPDSSAALHVGFSY